MSALLRWTSKPNERKIVIVGKKGCGKTGFLDRLKYNIVWEDTSPTKTVNVETLEYPKGYNWTIWEIGASSEKLQDLLVEHLSPDTFVIYLHDFHDMSHRISTLFQTLLQHMVGTGCKYLWIAFNRQDCWRPDRDATIDALRQEYKNNIVKHQGRISSRILTHKLSPKDANGTSIILDDIFTTAKNPNDKWPYQSVSQPQRKAALQAHLDREINQDTEDIEFFWARFADGDCGEWSHYNFIKAVYVIVLNEVETKAHCCDIADIFLRYAPRWHEKAANRTRLMFWILQTQYAVRDYWKQHRRNKFPRRGDFKAILRKNPSLMDGKLLDKYYSSRDLDSPLARKEWMPPPHNPLPWGVGYNMEESPSAPMQDDPDRLLAYAFDVLQYVRRKGLLRIGVTARALASLEKSMIRRRRLNPGAPPYSETQGYFWLQLVQTVLQSLYALDPESEEAGSECETPTARLTFITFKELTGLDGESWKLCYSDKVWYSVEARTKYILPDIKPVDNLVASLEISEDNHLLLKQTEALSAEHEIGLPSVEELTFRANLIVHWSQELDPRKPVITTHAHLLSYLYTNLVIDVPKSGPGTILSRRTERAKALFSEISGAMVDAPTHRNFWIQQTLIAVARGETKTSEKNVDTPSALATFADFVVNNLDLANEDLQNEYYSMEIWHSDEAREMILSPDKQEMTKMLDLVEAGDWVEV